MSDKLPSPSQILGGNKLPSPSEVLGSSLKKKVESQSQLEEASTSLDISDNQGDQPLGSSGDGDVYTYNGESYKKKGKKWYKESGGKYVPITAGNVAQREEILNTKAKKVVDRWANVTETKSEGKPIYKTDDYIDVVQSKDYIGASKPAYDQAYQMMKEDFGVKEFEAYNKIDGIDLDLIANTEEYTVAELNKRFKGSGLYFEETGLGDQMRVVSTPDGGLTTTNEGVFNLYPKNYTGQSGIPTFDVASAEAEQKRLKEFLNNSLLKKSEKEYIQSDNIKSYGDLVKLQVENPRKYGENFLDEQSTTNWIDNQYLDLAIETKSLKREQDALNKEIQQYKGREIPIDVKKKFESRINILTDKKESLINTHGELTNIQTGLKEATGYYYDANEKKGNIAGVIGRNFVKGLMNLPKMEMDLVADAVPFIFGENATSSVQRTKMEAAGMSDTEINNTLTRDLKESVNKKAVKSLQDIASFGTTEEYAQSEDRNDLEKVAGFLAESVGTGLSAGGNTTLSKLAFFAQSYNAMEDQMNSKEFDDLNLAEKKLMSVPYGIAIGFLERLGFKATTGGSKLLSGVVTKSIARALTQVPKDASLALMKSAINKSVIATMAESGLSIVAGSFVEGSVEATQNTTEIGAKQLFNYLEGQEYFKDVPDLTTKEGMSKAVSMASEDFYYGMLGGIVMASGSEAVSAVKNGYSNKKQDESFDLFYNSITNDNLRNTVKTEIKSNLVTGKITKEEADAQMESVGKAYSVFKSIPDNLPTKDKRESFNLIVEKQTIEKEIEGKDPSLVDAQKKRVSEINESLKTISNNATKKTTEQQQASQAEGGISEYQGAGEGQQEVGNAERGQREAKVNEADSGDSTIPSKVQKEVATYRANEQAELLKEIPKIESYKVNGEIDKTLMPKTVLSKYNKIYNKYDKLISPLLETTTENKKTVEIEPKITETKDTKTYSEALSEAKSLLKEEGNGLDLQVSDVSKEEADAIIAEGGNIFMTEDGLAGAYVKKDGYMGGLFKSPKATYSKVAKLLQQARVKVGGRFMEAYATELEKIYVNNGFRPVARLKFNEEYAPEGWNAPKSALASKPDVVFFAYDPDGKYKIGDGEYLEDYDTAYEIAKNFKPNTVSNKVNYKQNLVTAENSTQVASRQDTPIKQNTAKSVKLITKALPGVKVYLHNNESEMHQALADATGMSVDEVSKEVGKSAGSQVKGEIHINMQTAKANTLMHEAFHEAILRSGKSVKTITDFANGLKNIISNKDIKAKLDEFVSMYEESDQSEEFLSELGSIMAEAETELTTTKLQQFLNLINRIAKSLGLPVILKSTATKQEAVDFINTIAKSLRTGEEIVVSDVTNVDTNELSIKLDRTGDFDISYFEDADEFKKLVKDGTVENNYDINKISGEVVAIHQPDNMFVGVLKNLDKILFNGNGGVFYTSITGNVWASGAESSAKSLAKLINKSLEESTDGIGRLVLVRGTDSKMISSTEGVKASMSIIELLVDKGLINRSEFRSSLIRAGKKFNIDFSGKDSSAAIHKDIKEKFMDVKNSTFQKRGDFFDEVINDLSKTSKSASENIDGIRKALGSKRKISFSKDGIRDSIGDILTERLLKDLPTSHAYAVIEVTEPVTYRENKGHDSYPWILESKSKPKLKLLSDRSHAVKDGVFEMIDGSEVTQGKLGLAQRGMGIAKISQQPSKIKQQKNNLPENVLERLTETKDGKIVFHHYSKEKRDVIKPMVNQASFNSSKEEIRAINSVGGVSFWYTMANQKEALGADELHTVLVPKENVYYLQKDVDGFYDEAKRQFNEVRPGQAFDDNYQAAWIGKVAQDNGYDILVSEWRNGELRAQSTKDIKPEGGNTEFKERVKDTYKVGEKAMIYGRESTITKVDGNILTYEGSGTSGTFDVESPFNARSIKKIRLQKTAPNGKPSKLDDVQWEQVRTPAFKRWFGDWENDPKNASKIVDSNGEPMPVYHGTTEDFEIFMGGSYFTDDYMNADGYASGEIVLETFLNIKNPLIIDAKGRKWDDLQSKYGSSTREIVGNLDEKIYDGVAFNNINDNWFDDEEGEPQNVYYTLEPNQVKLADGSNTTFDATKSSIKLQKTPQETRMDNESENVFKKSLDRGTNWATATQNALDYIQKSKWYQDATDIDREQKIRDFKQSKNQKIKKAPSVAKILGTPKPKMVTVNEVAAFKDQLRLEAKAAREAKADLNSKRKSLGNAIKGMVKLGKLKATQAVTIIKRVSQVNLDNPVMVERLIDYASRVFERADYQERLDRAFSYRRAIRRLLKSDNQAQVIGMANQFTKIDPSMVENIDEYIAMAEIVKNAVAPSRVKGLDVVLKESANIETVSNFVKDVLEKQEQKLKDELLATNNDLLESGVISDNMTVKEIQQIIDSIKDPEYKMDSQEKERYIRSYLSKRFESLASIVDNILETGENPFTGEKMAVSEKDGTIISNLLKVDLSEMSIRDAVFAVEAMDNFINNGITSKLEGVLASYQGQLGLKDQIKSGKVAKSLKLYFSKKLGRYFGTEFTPLPLMIERMFSGVTSGISVMKSMGLDVVINGVNRANKIHEKVINDYYEKFIKKSKTFHNPENVYERGMLSFLKRNVTGSLEEMNAETSRRIKMIEESINTLMSEGDETQKAMAEIYQKVFDKLGVSTGDIDVINSRASKENRDAVDWWINEWSKNYKDLADVSLSVYNYDLGSDLNYTPDRYKTIKTEAFDQKLIERNSSFLISMDHITDKGQTGVLMQANRPKVMPDGRYISLDFDSNNSNSLKGALVDINTAAGIRQVDGFLNSKLLSKLIPTSEDRDVLIQRTNRYIRRAKGKIFIPSDLYKDVDAVLNFAAGIGATKALGGVLQSVKQTIPIALSTAINTGKFNVAGVAFNEWLNKTGMPISNRGTESLSTIESIDRRMEAKGTRIKDSLKTIQQIQQIYLKFFLSRPDVFIARSGFESYYLQYLGKKSIDWANHEANQDALNYAQSMVDRQQNISDPMLGGEFLTAEDGMKRMAKKVLFPFASFALNQKARLNSDIINLASKTTSEQDKKIARKSAVATVAEMVAYRAISVAIGYSFYKAAQMIVNSFVGPDDDEEKDQDKKWLMSASKFPIKSMITDFASPIQMSDKYVTMGTDFLFSLVTGDTKSELDESVKQENEVRALKDQDPMTPNQEEDFRQKLLDKSTFRVASPYDENTGLGMVSIASDLYTKIYDDYTLAATGEFEDEYKGNKTTKKIRPVEQNLIKNSLIFSGLYAMGILPKESDQIVTKIVNMVKKNAMSESEYEKYSEFKTEFKREPNPFEMGMIKSEKKYQYISDDVNWVDTKGGLTLSQGREYVKIINTLGEVDNSTLLEIKAGKTADQIVKSMRAKL